MLSIYISILFIVLTAGTANCLVKLTASLPLHRHGRHHLLPGRPSAADEGEVPGL